MPNFAVGTTFIGKDQLTRKVLGMGKAMDKFGGKSTRAFRAASKGGIGFGSVMKGILAAGVIRRGIGLITQGVREIATEFVTFDDSIVAATARFKDLEIGSARSASVMEQLRAKAREVGATTQFTGTQAAQGLDFFARAGFKSGEAMAILKNQVDLATATGEDFIRVADISSDLLGSFGNAGLESSKKIAALKTMNNQLAVATNKANVTLEDMFETLKIAAPIATSAGEKQNKLISITAALGSAGIKGSLAATALKNAYIRLVDTTPKVDEELRKLNLSSKSFIDKSGKMKSMTDIMQLLGERTKGLGQAEQLKVFSVIFGKRAVAGATNLSKSLSSVNDILKAMEDTKAMTKIADQMRTSLGNRIAIIKSAVIELGFKFLSAFEKQGGSALEKLGAIIQKIDPSAFINDMKEAFEVLKPAIVEFSKAFAEFGGEILPETEKNSSKLGTTLLLVARGLSFVLKFSAGVLRFLKPLAPLLPVIVGGFLAYNLALKAMAVGAVIKSIIALVASLFSVASANGVATVAQWLLNVAMDANPVGLVIIGLAALVGLIVLVVKNWDTLTKFIKENTEVSMVLIGFILGPMMVALGFISAVILNVVRNWHTVTKAFKERGFIAAVVQFGRILASAILTPVEQFLFLLSKIPVIGDKIKGVAEIVKKFRTQTILGEGAAGKKLTTPERVAPNQSRVAPNQSQLEAQQGNINLNGQINIAGAPEGSTVESKTTGAKPINLKLLGQNP